MKKILGILLMAVVIMAGATSCKSKQKAAEISGANIEAKSTTTQPTTTTAPATTTVQENTRKEKFSLPEGETNTAAFNNKYHVVVGSFSIQQNAKNLQRTLNNEGNNALVVVNEQGMYRVLISSYNEYTQARARINEISSRFPDAWVLVQK